MAINWGTAESDSNTICCLNSSIMYGCCEQHYKPGQLLETLYFEEDHTLLSKCRTLWGEAE